MESPHAFVVDTNNCKQRGEQDFQTWMTRAEDGNEIIDEPDFGEDDLPSAGVVIEDLTWRVEKMRLEEANKRRFLKARPRFLPYKDARDWVHAWGQRWQTAQDWQNWIADGEKRNSYIPSRPDEYYTRTGDWISWDDYLGVESSEEPDGSDNDEFS